MSVCVGSAGCGGPKLMYSRHGRTKLDECLACRREPGRGSAGSAGTCGT
jgi:hypothetical protein